MQINQEVANTLDAIKALYATGTTDVNKATVSGPQGWNGSTTTGGETGFGLGIIPSPSGYPSGTYGGFTPYNLEPGARLLAPVITPIRNRIPRTKGRGTAVEFRAITNYNQNQAQSWASEGNSGPMLATAATKVVFPYKIQSLYNQVSFEAQYYGQGQVDAMALATANALRAFMIAEDNNFLFGNPATGYTGGSAGGTTVSIGGAVTPAVLTSANFAAAASGATNTITGTAFTGTLAAATYSCFYTVVTGPGQETLGAGSTSQALAHTGGTMAGGDVQTVVLGATGYLVFQPPVNAQALSYNLYYTVGAITATGANIWSVVTGVNGRVVIGAVIPPTIASTAIPSSANTNALTNAAFAGYDSNAFAYAGIFQQLLATGSGASILTLQRPLNMANNAFTDLDNLLLSIWNNGQGDPEDAFVNAFESLSITTGTLGAGTPYYITPNGSQNSATANFRVSRLTNKVTGSEVNVIVHPRIPQGTILALSTKLPSWYPGSDIPAAWEFNSPVDYQQLAYAVTGPFFPFEIRNWGAILSYLPLISGVLTGISKA